MTNNEAEKEIERQIEDFFSCIEEEGLDRDGLYLAWQLYKEDIEKRGYQKALEDLASIMLERWRVYSDTRLFQLEEMINGLKTKRGIHERANIHNSTGYET